MSRRTVNRTLLALVGLVLLAGGALVLLGGLDAYRHLGITPPGWWPLTSPDQPVLSTASRTRWSDRDWWWPVAIAVPALVIVGCLWWLFSQLRRGGPAGVDLPSPTASGGSHFALRVRSRAVEEAIETETVALPDVERVTTKVTGAARRPQVHTAVRIAPGADTAALVAAYRTGPVEHARHSLGLAELPAQLRLRGGKARKERSRKKAPRVR
ncbi:MULTISPECIES: alkaline shock response membrane anchor protein AmaP [unclassified Kitasatospora]|uniref:alkaline shock response membrane anchor protein AmaP n=1 Tax=unclassified Kitasatospora TaxID=2633591 RepID=UPI00381668AC